MHKKFLVLLIGLFLIAPFILAQGTLDKPMTEKRVGSENAVSTVHLSYIEGSVFFQGQNHETIMQGDGVRTENGRTEVYLGNRSWLRLDRYTRVVFSMLNDERVILNVWEGNVYIKAQDEFGMIGVKTPHKSFNLMKSGMYLIEVRKNKTNDYFNPRPENNFDRWNLRREKEVNPGLSKFDLFLGSYGRWYYNPLWGWTWRPWRWSLIYGNPLYWSTFSRYGRWHQGYWIPRGSYRAQRTIHKNQLKRK